MALKLKDGKYIKLDLDKCYIDKNGIHVAYFQYLNGDTRLKEESNRTQLDKLLNNISQYINEKLTELQSNVDYSKVTSEQELLDLMSDADKEIYETIHKLEEDVHIITVASQVGDISAEKKLNNLKLLKQFGYTTNVLEKAHLGDSFSNISGVLVDQKFTYEDMYKELKKIFKKEGYIDC